MWAPRQQPAKLSINNRGTGEKLFLYAARAAAAARRRRRRRQLSCLCRGCRTTMMLASLALDLALAVAAQPATNFVLLLGE
jgi:hypothetical protein